ncbi:MAG: ATP-binding protein, partial [Pseudomonadota bacterium]|nr:ATP-binding protein [Pseudomonadota bacterium]
MTENKHEFKAEVTRLLDIVTHSLYSHREIFLRELISNGADACDRLRFLALQNPDLTAGDGDFAIRVAIDKEERTVTVTDNGIGMDKDDLIDQLGTIARSGTADFIHHHKENGGDSEAVGLIGQFGIGFYAAFMVSEKV